MADSRDLSRHRPLTEQEAVAAIRWTLQLRLGKVTLRANQRFTDAVLTEMGIDRLSEEIARHLMLRGLVLAQEPPAPQHGSFLPKEERSGPEAKGQ